ncbi:hypothetical protein LX32DRAFT_271391 [Colletotrichum zoysiae]|uniref:Uncharacterized protein n=1 Tax=Colletotrichum zoysiae TaxID=1216348 RepID=A0AAD9LWS4_9PEZI|nr:hypothetical protein LX32DRAFT_271391 [Colletotrichum zoysiae]
MHLTSLTLESLMDLDEVLADKGAEAAASSLACAIVKDFAWHQLPALYSSISLSSHVTSWSLRISFNSTRAHRPPPPPFGSETASDTRTLLEVALRDPGELVGYGGRFNRFETAEGGGGK